MVRAFSWLVSGNNGFSLCGVLFRVALRSMIDYIIFATPHRATINRLMTTLYITKIAENPMRQRLETLATANYPYEKPNFLGARNHRASRAPTRTHSLTVSSRRCTFRIFVSRQTTAPFASLDSDAKIVGARVARRCAEQQSASTAGRNDVRCPLFSCATAVGRRRRAAARIFSAATTTTISFPLSLSRERERENTPNGKPFDFSVPFWFSVSCVGLVRCARGHATKHTHNPKCAAWHGTGRCLPLSLFLSLPCRRDDRCIPINVCRNC